MADSFSFMSRLARRAIPWLGSLATIAALALLAWVGARIFWTLSAPAPAEPALAVDTDPSRVAQAIATRHLFGEAPDTGISAAVPEGAINGKLNGVIAPSRKGGTAIAIVSIDGKPAVAVREGDELMPGVILHRVLSRSVEIRRGGKTLVLALPQPGKS